MIYQDIKKVISTWLFPTVIVALLCLVSPGKADAALNYRSIGTSAADLKTGTPTVTISSGIATFNTAQTGNIGLGDKLTYNTSSVAYITAKTSTTVFSVQTESGGIPSDVTDATVNSITRAYNTLQAWEDARGGNLVSDDRIEVGVAYKDGAFTSTNPQAVLYIKDNTTDSTHYFELTVAEGNRHDGTAGATGTSNAMIDGENGGRKGIWVQDDQDVRIKWLELKNFSGANYANAVYIHGTIGSNVQLDFLLIHDFINGTVGDANKSYGIKVGADGNCTVTVRNCIIYNGDYAGITGDETTDTVTIENCTIYGILGDGIDDDQSDIVVRNTISMNNGDGSTYIDIDTSNLGATQEYNISSDGSASGTGSLTNRTATDNPNPGTGDWVVFSSLTSGSENFHLQNVDRKSVV